MKLKPGDQVDHLYFGYGKIASQTKLYYIIKFGDGEVRNIIKGHITLKKRKKDSWTISQKEQAQKYIEEQVIKRTRSRGSDWRNYQKS